MHLKSLSVNGFKSFAIPTTMQFTRGVTAIVGPNGSGKSNVADAVRWVLGEKSLKTLRGKKSADVIFAGSHLRAGHSMAEVTLLFDNSDGSLPVDAAEVAVTRRLFKNGDSEFEINGTQVRLMDLNELLIKAGLGERSYAVVGQGQVDAILRATSAERKEFFEEAAGVKQFQNKKEQALRKLETTRRNLIRVDDLIKEIKPRLGSLKRQSERAALHDQIQAELRTKSLQWFGAELASIDQVSKADIEKIADINKQRQILEKDIADLEKSHSAAEETALGEQRDLIRERLEQSRQTITELEAERSEARQKEARLQEKDLPIDLASLPTQVAETESRVNQLTRRASKLAPEVAKLRQQVEQAEKRSSETSSQIQELRSSLTKQRPQKIDQREINGIVKALDASFNQLVTAIKSISGPEDAKKVLELVQQPRTQLQDLKSRIGQSTPIDANKVNQELDRVLEARDDLLAQLADHREQLARRETEHTLLTKQIDRQERSLKTYQSQLRAAKSGSQKDTKQVAQVAIKDELKALDQKIAVEDEQIKSREHELSDLNTQEKEIRAKVRASLDVIKSKRQELTDVVDQQSHLNVEKGKFDVRREDLVEEAREHLGDEAIQIIAKGGADLLTIAKRQALKNQVDQLRKQLDQAGSVNETVLEEFKETEERHDFLSEQSKDLAEASEKMRTLIKQLDEQIQRRFARSVEQINREFNKAFKVLFDGGTAKLIQIRAKKKLAGAAAAAIGQEQEDEVAHEVKQLRDAIGIIGIDVKATPPGKKLQSVGMLSGGEKALTSIALLSAILATKPSPFVILDEVDAALDEANSRRFAKIIRSLADKTQFITISHNRATMRMAGILYGVTMQKDGVSKLLSVKLDSVKQDGTIAAVLAA